VVIHALAPSLVANDAVGLHLRDAGGERIGLGAVVRDVYIFAAMWHGALYRTKNNIELWA
jgi:hypothetical protein